MHWTLLVLIALCAACVLANAVQLWVTGSVRVVGMLVCGAWVIQQLHWSETGEDSLVLFLACDAAIIVWFLSVRRAFDLRERLIAASIPVTTALVVYAAMIGGPTVTSWWANWWIVAGQMAMGLPMPARQPASGSVTHGSLRSAADGGT